MGLRCSDGSGVASSAAGALVKADAKKSIGPSPPLHLLQRHGAIVDPSGIAISSDDTFYAAAQNDDYPDFQTAIYVASAMDGSIKGLIRDIYTESVVADDDGAVYTGIRGRTEETQVSTDALQRFVAH